MAFIQSRTSRGKKYWSIVECKRINGKPRTRIIEYLGTAESLQERLKANGEVSLKSYSHGAVAALLKIATDLGIEKIINRHVPNGKQHRDGLSVGMSIVLAAIGRACEPTSKRGWHNWCKGTSLEYLLGKDLSALDSQHFWDQMHALPEERISSIEKEIVTVLLKQNSIDFKHLYFDTTNFFTFIDSSNTRTELAKRGRNKQKRFDLRQFGLALLINRQDQIPLFHKIYEGNKNDITVFKETILELVTRVTEISSHLNEVTLIFDKGNNSKENFKTMDDMVNVSYVGALSPHHFKPLIEQAARSGGDVYRAQYPVWGQERTCVVFLSEEFRASQVQGIAQHLDKATKELLKLQKRKRKLSQQNLKKKINAILHGQFLNQIVQYKINGQDFSFWSDHQAFSKLYNSVLGRQILVTNRHSWSSDEIINAFNQKAKVEYAFRNLKNPDHLALRPQFHWTDQKLRVHALLCVIAYLLTMLLFKNAKERAQYPHDVDALLNDLQFIRLAAVKHSRSSKISYQLESLPPSLKALATTFNINPTLPVATP
jgi:transposase